MWGRRGVAPPRVAPRSMGEDRCTSRSPSSAGDPNPSASGFSEACVRPARPHANRRHDRTVAGEPEAGRKASCACCGGDACDGDASRGRWLFVESQRASGFLEACGRPARPHANRQHDRTIRCDQDVTVCSMKAYSTKGIGSDERNNPSKLLDYHFYIL